MPRQMLAYIWQGVARTLVHIPVTVGYARYVELTRTSTRVSGAPNHFYF